MSDFPWYIQLENGDESLAQGDLIFNCPVIIPPSEIEEDQELEVEVELFDIVVLTQTCDLDNSKITQVQVCPFFNLDDLEFIKNSANKREERSKKEKVRQGNLSGYHLLNSNNDIGLENFLIVDFRNTYAIHKSFLQQFVKNQEKRIRLLPPYREHLAQSFARYFMRVGLPVDIPSFR